MLVVVIRYYGGTKLGVGGLVKTYKEAAKITLEEAEIIIKELESTIEVTCHFNQQNLIFTLLNKFDAKVINFDSQSVCIITAIIKTSQKENISEKLSEMNQISFKIL